MSLIGELERNPVGAGVLRFITAGSVDDGKSTLIGRLLHDSHALLEDQLDAVVRASHKRGQDSPDLSLITDGLEAEREQGITIDVAYRYFATPRRKFIIADTPGHEQYTRNMVTAASTADAAVILVDAGKGVLEQTRRHLALVSLLRIRHVIVAVNKMDSVGYARTAFESVRRDVEKFSTRVARMELQFIPLSALRGDLVVERGANIDWYDGPTLIEALEKINVDADAAARPLRFPVQLVARPEADGPRRYLGRIESGVLLPGSEIVALPSGVRTLVKKILKFDGELHTASAGDSVAIVLRDELDISRGDMLADRRQPPRSVRSVDVRLCWLAGEALLPSSRYLLKHTTRTVKARVNSIHHRLDVQALEPRAMDRSVGMNDIVSATLSLAQPILCDAYREDRITGAFILIDELSNQTVAAGVIE